MGITQWEELEVGLKAPFHADDIEHRIAQSGLTKQGKPWAKTLAFLTARAVQNRLDDLIGPQNWQVTYRKEGEGFICSLSLRCPTTTEWIIKENGAAESDVEGFKGGISDAMKRAAVEWGIGRYLYQLDTTWAVFTEDKSARYHAKIENTMYHWNPSPLPDWALPKQPGPTDRKSFEQVPEALRNQPAANAPY